MKTIQDQFWSMDKIIHKADLLLRATDQAFKTKDYFEVNNIRRELRELIDEYYKRPKEE